MDLHSWWSNFGAVCATDDLSSGRAQSLVALIVRGGARGVRLIEIRRDEALDGVYVELEVERPQILAHPLKGTEPIAFVFPRNDEQPRILALRADFPDTPHQNWTPENAPCSLCIDDRPWSEAKLTLTSADLVRRVQLWLAKAARGDLHDPSQPLDPLFFRSALSLVIPPSVFATPAAQPAELLGFARHDNPGVVLTRQAAGTNAADAKQARFLVLPFLAEPQKMARLRHAPATLGGLHAELDRCGIDLLRELKNTLVGWTGMEETNLRRLNSQLIILVIFPVQEGVGRSVNDLRAFVSNETAGEIGVRSGLLYRSTTQIGGRECYCAVLGVRELSQVDQIAVEPAEVHLALDRDLAASIAGRQPDRRKAILIGAGSLGSQLALNLAREGSLSWTIIDQDCLMPHNLARHALFAGDVGAPKAFALARQMGGLLGEHFDAMRGDITNAVVHSEQELLDRFAAAEVILDASASVAVSRQLSDMEQAKGRRVCVFFNPAGNAVIVMAESGDRRIRLRDLEAQYHGLILSERRLSTHLASSQPGLRYSGSCRAVTNRIAATQSALLSAIAARGVNNCFQSEEASIRVWTLTDQEELELVQRRGLPVTRTQMGRWNVTYDRNVMETISRIREQHLPDETGGVLLGIIDVDRRSIHIVQPMSPPEDSRESEGGFERGVVGLVDAVAELTEASLHQLRYIGEWHSHPRGSTVRPSNLDIEQLAWLANELQSEGIPALMAIAGDDGAVSVMLLDEAEEGEI
jgi:proteasome lid subunit RPN8/RPN11